MWDQVKTPENRFSHNEVHIRAYNQYHRYILLNAQPKKTKQFMSSFKGGIWLAWVDRNQILSEASLGMGKGCIRFWTRSDQNSGVHGKDSYHRVIMGKML